MIPASIRTIITYVQPWATLAFARRTNMQLSDLNRDVILHILCSISSFSDLSAVLHTAKEPFFNAFRVYTKSIMEAVTYNLAGPAHDDAFTVFRYTSNPESFELDDDGISVEKFLSPPRCDWIALLEKNANIVDELENLFSVR